MTPKRVAVMIGPDTDEYQPYLQAIQTVGLEPVVNAESMDGLEGLLLCGGNDVNPARYGEAPHEQTQPPDDPRDERESKLLAEAARSGAPVFAICRGLQMFNVFAGGTLHQHIEGHKCGRANLEAHPVKIDSGSQLAKIVGSCDYVVNSRHHQAANRIGSGLLVTARATDDVVEGIEVPGSRFVLAVQWHPETRFETHEGDRRLFEAFARAVAENRR
jgi:putative glutamine amidotransferase